VNAWPSPANFTLLGKCDQFRCEWLAPQSLAPLPYGQKPFAPLDGGVHDADKRIT
jgi:hypothetical protein